MRGAPAPEALDDMKGKWEIMSREFQQKQELVHRLMRENDEKSDALKLTVKTQLGSGNHRLETTNKVAAK